MSYSDSAYVGASKAVWDAINVDLQQCLDNVSCWEGKASERLCDQLGIAIDKLNAAVGHEREGYEAAIASSYEIERLQEQRDDLLKALRRVLEAPKETLSDGKALREIVRITRAAIAKAEGAA
jgi:uncharacterized protein (UPF0335 family)